MLKEYIGKQTVASLIRLIKNEFKKYVKTSTLDERLNGILPVATTEILGGVKPVTKTEEMTQGVGVDETGGLWTVPVSTDGNDIVVLNDTKGGTIILQENTYYQIYGGSEKKKLTFYNSDGSVGISFSYQILNIYCGSIDDNANYGLSYPNNIPVAYLSFIGNDTGFSTISSAKIGCYPFKKRSNNVFRAEVAYPAGSEIIIQTKSKSGLPPITK